MKFVVLSGIIILVLLGSTEAKRKFRIAGGQPAKDGQFPFLVSVRYFTWHRGGGTIISERLVLTAAHVIYNKKPAKTSILAGTVDRKVGGVRITASGLSIHPKYKHGSLQYDIGLVHLISPLTYNVTIQPAVLPLASELETILSCEGCIATVIGWGKTHTEGDNTFVANYVGAPISKKDRCSDTPFFICTEGAQNSCTGDSGGPLVIGNKVIGVVSGGYGCASKLGAFYSNVAFFAEWIAENSHLNNSLKFPINS